MSNASSTCRKPARRVGSIAAAFASVVAFAHVVCAERAPSQYLRDEWGRDRGYPGGPVHAIAQTADGYLWIGAEKGLVRFDGLTFTLVDPQGIPAAGGPTVLGIAAAPDGSLWARLPGVSLVRYQRGVFENIVSKFGVAPSIVSAMLPGPSGGMLVATVGGGAMVYRDERFEPIVPAASIPSSSFVIAMAEAAPDERWLGTRHAGLLRVQGQRVTRFTDGLPDLKINCLLAREPGDLWIGTDKGVARWVREGGAITTAGVPREVQGIPVLAMIRDRASNIWIAAGSKGLLRVDSRGVVTALDRGAARRGHVSTLFEDREGNVWIGTDSGIERWRAPLFATYSAAQGLVSEAIGPVYVDGGGRAWLAPTNGGLYTIDNDASTAVAVPGLERDVIYSIDGAGGEVWIATQRGGIARIVESGGRFVAERFTHRDGLAQDSVFVVARMRDGAVWAGTLSGGASRFDRSGGASRFDRGSFTTYNVTHGLVSNSVAAIVESRDGTIWFATPNGLSALTGSGWRTYTTERGLPSNDVNALYEDSAQRMWIGTAAGPAVIANGRIHAPPNLPKLLTASFLGLTEDRDRSLWIKTANHLVRVDGDRLLQGTLGVNDVREYDVEDGLLAVESAKRHRTIVADGRGRIWIASNRGVAVADPADAAKRAQPALTHVETLTVDGAPIDLRQSVRFPSSRRRIAIGYAGLSLSVPERVRFRYRLDPFDQEWSAPVVDRQAGYTNLAPGDYRFRVIASNSDGLWNGPEGTLALVVEPMIWQTASFRIVAVLFAAGLGWGLYRLHVVRIARQLTVRFDERLAERTRIAQELHDTLLQGFVSASMQLHVAVDRLPDDSAERPAFARVLDLMRRVIDEGRHAVRGLRSTTSAPDDLERAFSGIQQELAINRSAAYRVIVEGKPAPVNAAIRDEVYRIGREGLVNAFRHSDATRIEVELDYDPKELRIFVRDDGRGIDPQVVRSGSDGHWGLVGMRERAERIGGTLKVRSRAAAGTEIELRVPGRIAFDSAETHT